MADVVDERAGRFVYALEAALIGVPTLAVTIPVLFLGFLFLIGSMATMQSLTIGALSSIAWLVLLMLFAASSVAGLGAWCVLSGANLSGGRRTLKDTSDDLWVAMIAGIVAASIVLACCLLTTSMHEIVRTRWSWFMGPALIVPAGHLIALRFRK